MKPDKLEQHIKDQLRDREISPSRNLWTEIEADLKNSEISAKKNTNPWLWMAASMVILFGLSLFFINNKNEKTKTEPIIVTTETAEMPIEKLTKENTSESKNSTPLEKEIQKEEMRVVENKNFQEIIPQKNLHEPILEEKTKRENLVNTLPEISQNKIAVADTVQQPSKRKRYTDPNTLLYSVEHKDAINSTKKGSNVASIDLEK